jgi:toxin ParE1/3/4
MSNKFRKRSQADADLDSIWGYIAADNIRAADNLISRIGAVFEMLVQNPLAGRERPELVPGLRSFPVGSYVIFYVPVSDGIEVLRVMSGWQDADADDME